MMRGRLFTAMIYGVLAAWGAYASATSGGDSSGMKAALTSHAHASSANPAAKYDTSLPIEISSDTLEVFQHDNKAVFKGNVIAVQGKIRLNSDTMIVHYKQKSEQDKAATPPVQPSPPPAKPGVPTSSDQGEMGAITLIEVEGNVFMATPEESAKGDKGDYKVVEKMLHLTGDNVILTRDKNILRGTELFYNLETGHSVLTNHGAKVNGTNGGRVRGVFIPNKDDKAKPKKKPVTASASAVKVVVPADAQTVTGGSAPAAPVQGR